MRSQAKVPSLFTKQTNSKLAVDLEFEECCLPKPQVRHGLWIDKWIGSSESSRWIVQRNVSMRWDCKPTIFCLNSIDSPIVRLFSTEKPEVQHNRALFPNLFVDGKENSSRNIELPRIDSDQKRATAAGTVWQEWAVLDIRTMSPCLPRTISYRETEGCPFSGENDNEKGDPCPCRSCQKWHWQSYQITTVEANFSQLSSWAPSWIRNARTVANNPELPAFTLFTLESSITDVIEIRLRPLLLRRHYRQLRPTSDTINWGTNEEIAVW